MSTRSIITFKSEEGILQVYKHWDGYPGGLGYNLMNNWLDPDKVKEAILLGDASYWTDRPSENFYYGRDRGEINVDYKVYIHELDFLSRGDRSGEEFLYLARKNKTGVEWFVADWENKNLRPLAEEAIKERITILKHELAAIKSRKAA